MLHIYGAGISGLTTAFVAATRGHKVCVYEQAHIGAGASGQALGALVPSTLQRPIDTLQRQGISQWPALAAALAQHAQVPPGSLYRAWPAGGQLNLSQLFPAFEAALRNLGVTLQPPPAVSPPGPTLWATGWGVKDDIPHTTLSAGQVIRLALPPALHGQIPLCKQGNVYLVPAWNGTTLLVGSKNTPTDTPITTPCPRARAELRAAACAAYPALSEAPIVGEWVGNRPISAPRLPLIRPVANRLHHVAVAGLGGIGFALAPVVAEAALTALYHPEKATHPNR